MVSTSAIIRVLLITGGMTESKTTSEGLFSPWDSVLERGILVEKIRSEETLTSFLEELSQLMITWKLRHATILSDSTTDFDVARSLCEHRSCFLGRNISEFRTSGTFSTKSLVVSFLSTHSDGSANGIRMTGPAKCFADLTVFVARGFVAEKDAIRFFNRASYVRGIVVFANVRGGSTIKYYTADVRKGCETRLRSIDDWHPGKKIDVSPYYLRQMRAILRGCRMRVSTKNEMPAVRVETVKGRRTLTDGVEGKLMLAFAEMTGLRIDVKVVEIEDEAGRSMQDRVVEDVANGVSQVGIGQLRLHAELVASNVDIALARYFDRIVWCVPGGNSGRSNLITAEFSTPTWWIMFFVFVVLVCLLRVFLRCSRRFTERSRSRREEIGQRSNEWTEIVLEVFSLSLGNPVSFCATSTSIRILLSSFFYYVTVMTTAYKTSLSSELTATRRVPFIVDPSGIARANLTIGGITTDLRLLKDQIEESPENAQFVGRYVVYANRTDALARLRFNQNFAYVGMLTNVEYERNRMENRGETVNFDILAQPVSSFPSLIVFEKDSPLQEPFKLISHRLFESGIAWYWLIGAKNPATTKKAGQSSVDVHPKPRCVADFRFIFLLHAAICTLVCPLVLSAELIVHNFDRSQADKRHMLRK